MTTPITDADGVRELIATDAVSGVEYEVVKVAYGDVGSATMASATNPLPITGAGGTINIGLAPNAADTSDAVSAALQIRKVKNGTVDVTPLSAFANVATGSTDSVLVAAVTGKSIVVIAVAFVCGATATTAVFNSKPGSGAGSAISPTFANAANGGAVLNFNPAGWFYTFAGEALTVTTGGAGSSTGVLVSYAAV